MTVTAAPADVEALPAIHVDKVVAVLTSGRTGSSLVSSLLDSHPNVLSVPDCFIYGYFDFWEKYGDLPCHDLADTFVDYFATIFDGTRPSKCPKIGAINVALGLTALGENRDQALTADTNRFIGSMREQLPDNVPVGRRAFFVAAHIAYARAVGHQVRSPAIISFGLHIAHPSAVRAFDHDFPDAYYLHMVREPVQTVGSHFRNEAQSKHVPLSAPTLCVLARFKSGSPVLPSAESRSRAVRLEDLHRQPKETMLAVCGWLGIPWHPRLLESTFAGLKYWNDAKAIQVSGFSEAILAQSYADYIGSFDRFRLRALFGPRFRHFGYYPNEGAFAIRLRQLLALPLFVAPFKFERIAFAGARTAARFAAYLTLRKAIAKSVIDAPPTVSTIR